MVNSQNQFLLQRLLIWISLWFIVACSGSSDINSKKTTFLEIDYKNITSNLEDWNSDLALMFYAPWCKYCKQLLPSWAQISNLLNETQSLSVATFDCELNTYNTEICTKLGVDRYPALFYIGYGNFNQAPQKGSIFGKSKNSRVVRYNADLYPEAIYDWIQMLVGISSWQRRWDDIKGIFTGKTRTAMQVQKLQTTVQKLEKKVTLFSDELEKYKADELFDSLKFYGDPYPLLHTISLDDKTLPLRVCVAEMASEYCKYHTEDNACINSSKCLKEDSVPLECRPEKCPFSSRGCKVVSACMETSVIEQYKKALKS